MLKNPAWRLTFHPGAWPALADTPSVKYSAVASTRITIMIRKTTMTNACRLDRTTRITIWQSAHVRTTRVTPRGRQLPG